MSAVGNAAVTGNRDLVQLILEKECDMDKKSELLAYALCRAAWGGQKTILEFILNMGVGMDAQVDALINASDKGNTEIVKLLLDCGVEVNEYGVNDMYMFCMWQHIMVTKIWLSCYLKGEQI